MSVPARVTPKEQDGHRARIQQIEREARQASDERARQARLKEQQEAAEESLREARRNGSAPLVGRSADGRALTVRVDSEGYVIVKLGAEDLAALQTILRWTRTESGRSRADALDNVASVVEQILERYGVSS